MRDRLRVLLFSFQSTASRSRLLAATHRCAAESCAAATWAEERHTSDCREKIGLGRADWQEHDGDPVLDAFIHGAEARLSSPFEFLRFPILYPSEL